MSRRRRKKKSAGSSTGIPLLGKLAIALCLLIFVGAGAGFFGLQSYLRSENFRKFLSAQVSSAADVDGELKSLRWDGLQVSSDGFSGEGKGVVSLIDAEGLHTEIGFGGITRGVWEVGATRLGRIQIGIDTTKVEEPQPVQPDLKKQVLVKKQSSWLPDEVELESLSIGEFAANVKTENFSAKMGGMDVKVTPENSGKAYEVVLRGGKIETDMTWFPPLEVDQIDLRYGDGSIFIKKAEVTAWESGRITAFGEWNGLLESLKLDGEVKGVDCTEVLGDHWSRHITGMLETSYQLERFRERFLAEGELELLNGSITALPMLDALAAYADTRRFRMMQLNESRLKWKKTQDSLELTDLVLSTEGLMRVEGQISISANDELDGTFMVGIIPGILSSIPGAETDVFKPGKMGLLWTQIRVEGTLEDPKEDLTLRLIEAAGMRMLKDLPGGAEFLLKNGSTFLGSDESSGVLKNTFDLLQEGKELLDEDSGLIEEAGGILKGLFGK